MNRYSLSWLLCLALSTFSLYSSADVKRSIALNEIQRLYQTELNNQRLSLPERLERISRHWLHKPYRLFALGEGSGDEYDETPRYRTDAFDCETFVDTVLAIAFSTDISSFQHCMDTLRYKNGHVSFITRNHFTSIDWNQNNQHNGLLRDMTTTIHNRAAQSVAVWSETEINKANWYAHLPISRIRIKRLSSEQRLEKLNQLRHAGQHFKIQHSRLPYLPFNVLFDDKGRENKFIFNQIPHGAIIEIVKPNWDLTQQIGTHYDISHLGFAFWQHGVLLFREASSDMQQIIDIPLVDYLQQQRKNSSIQGINIQVVIPQTKSNNKSRALPCGQTVIDKTVYLNLQNNVSLNKQITAPDR
jgi:hypothetical protein